MSDSVNIGIILKQKAKSLYKEIFRKLIHLCNSMIFNKIIKIFII